MKHSVKAIADILTHEGFVTEKELVDGDFQVIDISRRNRNFRIECGDGKGFLVKQVKSADPQAVASFKCEAAVHWLAQNDLDFAPLNSLSPRCRGYDPNRNLLVIDLVSNAETLSEALMRGLSEEHANQIGQLLAMAHWHTGQQMLHNAIASPFNRQVPWTLTMHTLPVAQITTISEGCKQLLHTIQTTPALYQILESVRSAWSAQAFIHGDLKPDNCLVLSVPAEHQASVQFIDWELADFGDPAWDVAALLQGIWNTPLTQTGYVDEDFSFLYPVKPGIETLLHSYLSHSRIPNEQWSAMRQRVVQFASARMIQSAYEMLFESHTVSAQALLMLQAAMQIFSAARQIDVLLARQS